MDVKPVSHPPATIKPARSKLAVAAQQPPQTRLGDVLEFSGTSQLLTSLGSAGSQALQQLQAWNFPGQERTNQFLEALAAAETAPANTDQLLTFLAGQHDRFETEPYSVLWNGITQRDSSGELEYLDRLDELFSLGYRDVRAVLESSSDLSNDDFEKLLGSVSQLLQRGVIGIEEVDWRGNRTQVFIENEIASDYARAPLWDRRFPT